MMTERDLLTDDPLPQPPGGKPAIEARQGVISGRVLLVLVTSTILVVIALAAVAYAMA